VNAPAFSIRPANVRDTVAMIAIDRSCGHKSGWTASHFEQIFGDSAPARKAWLIQAEDQPTGFCVLLTATGDWELENIAVAPEWQRKGLGASLLLHAIAEARTAGSTRILLEVRASNTGAQKLYEKTGFQQLSTRPAYYSNPLEDAAIYELKL
jgi:ribosomal-protein-alanine N-acetyltransferase